MRPNEFNVRVEYLYPVEVEQCNTEQGVVLNAMLVAYIDKSRLLHSHECSLTFVFREDICPILEIANNNFEPVWRDKGSCAWDKTSHYPDGFNKDQFLHTTLPLLSESTGDQASSIIRQLFWELEVTQAFEGGSSWLNRCAPLFIGDFVRRMKLTRERIVREVMNS